MKKLICHPMNFLSNSVHNHVLNHKKYVFSMFTY